MKIEYLLVLGLLCACDDDEQGEGSTTDETTALEACVYDFTADVREGPDAPVHIEGKVTLALRDDGALTGELEQGGVFSGVSGRLADGIIELQFDLGGGKAIIGMGPFTGRFADCGGELEGDLAGPTDGSTGDWLAQPVDYLEAFCTVNVCGYRPRTQNECALYCGVAMSQLSARDQTRCNRDCTAGETDYQFYGCEPLPGTGPGVSQFFPPMSNEC